MLNILVKLASVSTLTNFVGEKIETYWYGRDKMIIPRARAATAPTEATRLRVPWQWLAVGACFQSVAIERWSATSKPETTFLHTITWHLEQKDGVAMVRHWGSNSSIILFYSNRLCRWSKCFQQYWFIKKIKNKKKSQVKVMLVFFKSLPFTNQ